MYLIGLRRHENINTKLRMTGNEQLEGWWLSGDGPYSSPSHHPKPLPPPTLRTPFQCSWCCRASPSSPCRQGRVLNTGFSPILSLQGKQTHPAEVRFTTCPMESSRVYIKAPLVAQKIKNPPAMQETWVGSLGPEDPLEKGMATHSSILAWEIPRAEEPGRLQSLGSQRAGHD